jgi:hypothetical protein
MSLANQNPARDIAGELRAQRAVNMVFLVDNVYYRQQAGLGGGFRIVKYGFGALYALRVIVVRYQGI